MDSKYNTITYVLLVISYTTCYILNYIHIILNSNIISVFTNYPAKQNNNRSPIETSQKFQWFPLKYHYKPLAFSSKTITKNLFVVCFGYLSNRI